MPQQHTGIAQCSLKLRKHEPINKWQRQSGWQRPIQHGHQGMAQHAALPMPLSGEGEERAGRGYRKGKGDRTEHPGTGSPLIPGLAQGSPDKGWL